MRSMGVVLLALGSLAALGCGSRVAVTDRIRNEVSEDDFRRLQLYVSSDIVLQRVLKSEETGVGKNHVLRIDKGRKLEEIIIAASTPGVVVKSEPKRLYVSFESPVDGEEVFVTFELGNNGYKEGYYMFPNKMGDQGQMLVHYGGKVYAATTESRLAHLMVEEDKVRVNTYEARQVPGRLVSDGPNK